MQVKKRLNGCTFQIFKWKKRSAKLKPTTPNTTQLNHT